MQITIRLFLSLFFCVIFSGCQAAPQKSSVAVETQETIFKSLLNGYRCDEGSRFSPAIKTYKYEEFTTYESVVEVLCNGMPHPEHYVVAASYKSNSDQKLLYQDLIQQPSLEEEISLARAYAALKNPDCKNAIYSKSYVYFYIREDGDMAITVNAAYPAMECTIKYNIDRPEKSEFPFF